MSDACSRQAAGAKECPCTYPGCPRHGNCCQCLAHHRAKDQLPACYFSPEAERTFDRSISFFISLRSR